MKDRVKWRLAKLLPDLLYVLILRICDLQRVITCTAVFLGEATSSATELASLGAVCRPRIAMDHHVFFSEGGTGHIDAHDHSLRVIHAAVDAW